MIGFLISLPLVALQADAQGDKAPLAAQVDRLVRQLDAREVGQRDLAERKLLELGSDVLPLLPTTGERTSAEVAQRVERVRHKLLRAQALAAIQPSLVTLHGNNLPLAEVLAHIARQTNNPVSDHREAFGEKRSEPPLNVDFDKMPFWRALDNVLDQADLTLYPFAGKRGAFVVSRPPDTSPRSAMACYAGIFRLEPLRFEAVRDLRNERMQSLKFFMEVSWEPRMQPFAIVQPLSEVSAQGNNGKKVSVSAAEAEPEALIREGVGAAELEIPFVLPPRSTEKLTLLKGKLVALVPGRLEDFRFADLPIAPRNGPAKRVEQRKGGTLITVDHVRKNNEIWEVGLRMKFEAPTAALESHRSWILENEAFFAGPGQERIEPGGMEQTLQNKDEIGINYFFDLEHGPGKLTFVYRTPMMILEIPVEYEFHDLRLP